jgi:hypothetical protein
MCERLVNFGNGYRGLFHRLRNKIQIIPIANDAMLNMKIISGFSWVEHKTSDKSSSLPNRTEERGRFRSRKSEEQRKRQEN